MNSNSESIDVEVCKCGQHENETGRLPPCRSAEHWSYALAQIRTSIYNSTSVALPNPGRHLMAYDRKINNSDGQDNNSDVCVGRVLRYDPNMFDFNAEPMATSDLFTYRRHRSEHLLVRLFHHFFYNKFQNLIRLSHGVFLSQKWEENEEQQTYPSPTSLNQAINSLNTEEDLNLSDNDNINTFSYTDIFGMILQEDVQQQEQEGVQQQEQEEATKFVPFSYTLGVRYTNPYNDFRDIVIRGHIPLWCQILFISSCLQQSEPIQPGTRRKGLLPFAMDISFSFTTCPIPPPQTASTPNSSSIMGLQPRQKVIEPYPLHTVLFERMCMELSEPEMISDDKDLAGISWQDRQESILRGILLCDIPDALANAITEMANAWAANQGIPV